MADGMVIVPIRRVAVTVFLLAALGLSALIGMHLGILSGGSGTPAFAGVAAATVLLAGLSTWCYVARRGVAAALCVGLSFVLAVPAAVVGILTHLKMFVGEAVTTTQAFEVSACLFPFVMPGIWRCMRAAARGEWDVRER